MAADTLPVAFPDHPRDHAGGAGAQPDRDGYEKEGDGKGEAHRGQFRRAQLGNKERVRHVEGDDRQDGPDHRDGHGGDMAADRPVRQASRRRPVRLIAHCRPAGANSVTARSNTKGMVTAAARVCAVINPAIRGASPPMVLVI